MADALRTGWPHLLIEAGGTALILFAACVYATLLNHPASPVPMLLPSPAAQRLVMGLAMGTTVAAFTYSPLGRRSGAHLNPAVTLTFLRLGRVPPSDAVAYVTAQFAGAVAGIGAASLLLRGLLAHPSVHYVVTLPGPQGALAAAGAELAISTVLMLVVLTALGTERLMRYTGLFSALLVALFIAVESPISGASMNPARSFGSALGAGEWSALWVYVVGPPLGMLLAAELHRRRVPAERESRGGGTVGCAKLAHEGGPCRFCEYRWARAAAAADDPRREGRSGTRTAPQMGASRALLFRHSAVAPPICGAGNHPAPRLVIAATNRHQVPHHCAAHSARSSPMTRSKKILIGAGAVILVAGWYAFRPERLWIDQVVSESFDTTGVALSGGAVDASAATGMPTMISMGRFHGVAHDGMGLATIYRTADGRRTLRLTQFETSNGPELHLYLVAAPDAKDDATVKRAGFIDLGPLKGNKGDQNYEIPDSVDVSKYGAVTVWCRRFGVNFTTAPLAAADIPAAASAAEPMPESPAAIAAGSFHSNAHETKGTATIYRRADGARILRLTSFETSNGPDVRVYLVAAPDVQDDATVKRAGFVELGKLKGNRGDQNYEIPASVDLAKYRSVTIWCARFNVNFGTAPLSERRS